MYKSNLNATWGPKQKTSIGNKLGNYTLPVDKVQWASDETHKQQRAAAASFVVAATVAVAAIAVAAGSVAVAAAAAAHIS